MRKNKTRRKLGVLHDSRAITPVLSNLLLTVVAVAIMALAASATYVITLNLRGNMSERLVIEDTLFDSEAGNIDVYIHNVGKVAIHVAAVYVNHTSQFFSKPFDLELGSHGWLNISLGWASGSLYYIDVVTTRGTHVGGYYKAI